VPSARVAAAVVARWHGVGGWDRTLRVLPDGCADLIWNGDGLVVVGARPGPQRFPVTATGDNVGLRLRPGAAAAVLGVDQAALPDGAVAAGDLWGADARRLEDRLAAVGAAVAGERRGAASGAGPGPQHEVLEDFVAGRLLGDAGPRPDPLVVAATHWLSRTGATVDGVGRAVGLSPRELRRRFLFHVGYGPKVLQRVLRFGGVVRALAAAPASRSLADLAVDHGYADQSHLGRECRLLSGSSPAALRRRSRLAAS
jgi:AraC-like DNA-binding protein